MIDPDEIDKSADGIFITRSQSRAIDQLAIHKFGIPGIVLMENAGRGCTEQLWKQGCQGPVVVLCGPGNNGGDGLVIARQLAERGVEVRLLVVGNPADYQGDAKVNFEVATRFGLPIVSAQNELEQGDLAAAISSCHGVATEWIVDAILGTGAEGPPRPLAAEVIRIANRVSCRKMAVDLPSGLDCETGEAHEPTFRAEITCTFVASKTGFSLSRSRAWLGEVRVIGIGVLPCILDQVVREA